MEKQITLTGAAKAVKWQLKAEFPKCTFSVRVEHHCELVVSLMAAPFVAFGDLGKAMDKAGNTLNYTNYSRLNKRQLLAQAPQMGRCNGRLITLRCWTVMRRAMEIALASFDFDGEVFFLSAAVGKPGKLFVCTEKPQVKVWEVKGIGSSEGYTVIASGTCEADVVSMATNAMGFKLDYEARIISGLVAESVGIFSVTVWAQ